MGYPAFVGGWGSTAAERASAFGCDALLPDADQALFRAVDVAAPAATTFRWLCQLRVAPYSYDRLDNLGRRSPRTLTPGLEHLERGQRMMTIFRLEAFEPGRSLTVRTRGAVLGEVACTYRADPVTPERSRIVVKLLADSPRTPGLRQLARLVLPPGDLVMMRRQLLTLRDLASATTSAELAAR